METTKIAQQMIELNKATFDNSFHTMVLVQEQTEKVVSTSLQQSPWLPDESKKVINEWMSMYKKGRDEFKRTVDENYKRVQDYFARSDKPDHS